MILDYKGKRLFAFSDTHGRHRDLSIPQSADILVCAGDVVSDFQENGLEDFLDWFSSCPAKLRLFIPGNHEVIFDICPEETRYLIPANITLLEDCGIEYEGITFYSISSRKIQQMEWIGEECGLSVDTDFLITHIPPEGVLDEGTGSKILAHTIFKQHPKFHLFGHVHSQGGQCERKRGTTFVNVSVFQTLYKKGRFSLNDSVSLFGQ